MTADLPITKARHHARPVIGISARYAQRSAVNPARCGNFKPALRITRRCSYGSAVSPVLANLFMHYAFDTWMARTYPDCPFERYADDAVVHCRSRRRAQDVLAGIAARMQEVGLRLHPDKTKIVYCKDSNRRGDHEHTAFTFLGYTFRPREARRKDGKRFVSFSPAVSSQVLKAKHDRLREIRIHRKTNLSLNDLAAILNPIVGGWMDYYGHYYRSALYPLLRHLNTYLRRWAWKKYKRLRGHKRFQRWWNGILAREPRLFTHWRWVPTL
jgi:RNA-directed DNA polymerase